ncbi:sterile alpha motif domain-containing protein 9-like [Hemibagrus wyckioides]|uniref:sterile alpha motif domain-containing protein 9-like n=1 Tax=Hemibagrus wyckioides TaxID=337641 RepID=UPI00266D8DAC|nr:sterile alpha motif domain-containing protein 9-like [Hemibagrus wyckioides]XP_058240138.1 sterile alpha motif domain-containing protein 9-like [Hemibagrus wyckioides]
MAYYTVPSQRGGQIPLQTKDRDCLSNLDVVWANKYEGETISPINAKNMELKFYKGAPPQWLNFYWAEKENSPFVKRDKYQELLTMINKTKNTSWSTDHINLFHEPGSGGSTLAMQVLWDLRKRFRCAKVLDSTTDAKATAQEVLRLFKAGGLENQNTVLLLLDNKYTSDDTSFRESLEEKLCDEMKVTKITTTIPVVIILNCLRQRDNAKTKRNISLHLTLSTEEHNNFDSKLNDIIQKHGDRHAELYAFNIMQSKDRASYVEKVCRIHTLRKKRRPRKQQLLAFLALINSYVPGSDLPLEICELFIKKNADNFSLETHMQPFTDFLVIFSTSEEGTRSEDIHVRLVHPMIAHEFLRLLTEAGVTRSDTTLKLLRDICRNDMTPCLEKIIIKRLLTKRECSLTEQDKSSKGTQDKFSKLLLDIEQMENKSICIAVLKRASKIFKTDPFYPQALARFYYIELEAYESATHWAKMAIRRDERNSFIRDTLGQVQKNYLKRNHGASARKILQLGKQATNAFKDEQEFAEKEEAPEMPGMPGTATIFNTRGIFGYMQVANIIFGYLTKADNEWAKVLTKETNPHCFLNSYEKGMCQIYKSLIKCLRDEVEDKFEFFEWYLLYSKPSIHKDEPAYFRPEVYECYSKFVKQSQQNRSALQILKEREVSTFAGLLNTELQGPDLEVITEQWKEMYLHSPSEVQNIQNYIVAQVLLSQRHGTSTALRPLEELQTMLHNLWTEQKDLRSPEFYLLVLLLFWPGAQQDRRNSLDISQCVKYMHHSFERVYKYFLRSRYLRPLFFLSVHHGLQRFVQNSFRHKSPIYKLTKDRKLMLTCDILGCDIPQLLRVRGEVKDYKVFAVQGSEKIEVSPDHPASVRGQGQVTFYLGLNIKGPVAYEITYEK